MCAIDCTPYMSGAEVKADLTSTDTEDKIYQWYNEMLTQQGWVFEDFSKLLAPFDKSGKKYHKGNREEFWIFIYGSGGIYQTTNKVTSFHTIYSIFPYK